MAQDPHPGGGARPEPEVRLIRDEVVAELAHHPQPRLLGILAVLEWALGQRETAPISGPAKPPSTQRRLAHEEYRAHQACEHPRLSGVDAKYVSAVEHTLRWLEGKTEYCPRADQN
jgi:hypothetical protein